MSNKILVIDDDADTRRGLKIRLQASGYETAFAADAVGAVSAARTQKPDLILLDLGLPGGDGFLVLQRLQSFPALSQIPVIVLSARDPEDNREKALSAGAVQYFQKPVENEALIRAISDCLVGT